MEGVEAKVVRTIEDYKLVEGAERVLVACSGGPDSVCLLDILDRLKSRYRYSLMVFHLNHRLREEAAEEAEFVRRLSSSLNLPFLYEEFDVARYAAAHRLSIEVGARQVRYRLLEVAADSVGAQRIALGHNLQDQAETIILNLVRGAGLSGLGGMPVRRGRFIRPLISVTREEIIDHLNHHRLSYCQDRSNLDPRFRRNLIRLEILPRLLRLNPRFLSAVDRTTKLLRAENRFLNSLSDEAVNLVVIEREPEGLLLDVSRLLGYPEVIRRRLLRRLRSDMSLEEVERVLKVAQGRVGGWVELKGGWIARHEQGGLYLGGRPQPYLGEVEVAVPGSTQVEELGLNLVAEVIPGPFLPRRPGDEAFDLEGLSLPLKLRTRRPGDRILLSGDGVEKRLKEVFIDDKVPHHLRARIPLLCDGVGVLWVVGRRRSARALIGPRTQHTLLVRVERWNGSRSGVVGA